VLPERRVRFSVWAPHCRRITVELSGKRNRSLSLALQGAGLFTGILDDVDPGSDYFYRLDQGPARPDPVSRYRPAGVHGPTRIVDPTDFNWSDQGWTGVATADLVIYELHIGTFTSEGTFDSAIERLPMLGQLGVTAVEIMPVAEFPGNRNWGYDGVSLYAPQSTYGGPEGLRRLVNASHREGLAVILDVVYNHAGPEGNNLPEFGPYFCDRHRTPWGKGWNLDRTGSSEVRRYLVDNALYWITEFHLDGLRLDAADQIADQSEFHILEEIASAVRDQSRALGRTINLIAESDSDDQRFIQRLDRGGHGFDTQWKNDFHHAVHSALTGESQGYFADFGGIGSVASALSNRPSASPPSGRFVVFIQNHDQVGNRAGGERLSVLVSAEALRLAAAVLLLSPDLPLLFMGEEYGETNPFLYFVSHGDPALVEAVREGRRREFAAFEWPADFPDPQAEATFSRSRLDWSRATVPAQARLRALYTDLLSRRRNEPALRPDAARISVSHDDVERWLRVRFALPGSDLVAVFNFADVVRTVAVPKPGRPHVILSTDDAKYGGSGDLRLTPAEVTVPPLSAVLLGLSPA
jgi:maltooligosyltrehalose trehalohydrolase